MEIYNRDIILSNINKRHGNKLILNNVSFKARQGCITAFLGANGAGKSSTLRILLGLDYQTSGEANFGNIKYSNITNPLTTIGASFDGLAGPLNRKVVSHLKIIAQSNGISFSRINEVLEIVGLSSKAKAYLGSLSLGEGQRLGIAIALIGDPQYLVLDEPTNGLDPSGIRWFKTFIKTQAKLGKTILLSSHILSDVQEIADDIVIIKDGVIVINRSTNELESLEDIFFEVTEGKTYE